MAVSLMCPSWATDSTGEWQLHSPVLGTHVLTLLRLLIMVHHTISGDTWLLIISKLLSQRNGAKPPVQEAKL